MSPISFAAAAFSGRERLDGGLEWHLRYRSCSTIWLRSLWQICAGLRQGFGETPSSRSTRKRETGGKFKMSTIWALIKALPEILALLKLIDAKCKEIKIENDVKKTFKPYTRLLKKKDPK